MWRVQQYSVCAVRITIASAVALLIGGYASLAQQPGGPGQGFPGQPGVPRGGNQFGGQFAGTPAGMPPGMGMPGMGMRFRPLTALDIPAPALQQALGLNDDQTLKIMAIQSSARPGPMFGGGRGSGAPGQPGEPGQPGGRGFGGRGGGAPGQPGEPGQPGGPGFGGRGGGAPGQPGEPGQPGGPGFGGGPAGGVPGRPGQPGVGGQGGGSYPGQFGGPAFGGPEMPGTAFGFGPQEQGAIKSIYALLTPAQKKALPTLLRQFESFQSFGVPLEVIFQLKLSPAQREKIAAVAESQQEAGRKVIEEARATGEFEAVGMAMQKSHMADHEKLIGILTDAQKQALTDWMRMQQQGPGARYPGGPNPDRQEIPLSPRT